MTLGTHRNTWIEVNLKNIEENISNEKKILSENVAVFAVVKANGYGHGAVAVAKAAKAGGATGFCVALLDEALELRAAGINEPIIILAPIRAEDVAIAQKESLSIPICDLEYWQLVKPHIAESLPLYLHLVIDSGMGRIGFRDEEEIKIIEKNIVEHPTAQLEGVFTHFATADELDTTYFKQQLKTFKVLKTALITQPKYIHCSNSAAALMHPELEISCIRLGIAMYGLSPSMEIKPMLPYQLKPALALFSKLTQVKWVEEGQSIGYGATYKVAETGEWIGTLPIGYADGWLRDRSGSFVLIEGQRCQIIGRVCMDQCMIRLPKYYPIDTTVTFIGESYNESVTTDDVADYSGTINYEIVCLLSDRIPRYYI
ncbi:alanine racemase [Brochothrix thermosphacta]|uniref:Alanine racemase n=1 Tax=Brochothrix thermosphacta TaxID=2756 RepID=A0A2X0Q417_BROTH|nr:alanine racemase [Brochothrix thermosphacta]SLN00383.1 Alanine racemase [Brachybacterium faecium]EUJ37419.1 alanine racemase [Brochothrix thermosphacta DSM 20171 = FSL F6-1036]ODJ48414.1 alanine racemase [Brochothrix thermosphacta DSM 20171 = FSL F6-1036]ODJ53920.1 alanine racemase [Brochothrix thermosphacta]ODJ58111.1 alanine racemase [Brochothrix thermosphacta]